MRGEETQIAGFLARQPEFDGVLCLPGTHTKWVHISVGEIVSFRTFMTGEIFALLKGQSVLRHSVADGWDEDAFLRAVSMTLSRPERLASELFSIRAAGLLSDPPAGQARAKLSGLLIGAELAATKPYWLGQAVAIIGDAGISTPYQKALRPQGVEAFVHTADALTQAGLTALYEQVAS
jgi:2-dehydro-3-deoxygalactonokinase